MKKMLIDYKLPIVAILSFAFYTIWNAAQLSSAMADTQQRLSKHDEAIVKMETTLSRLDARQELILQTVQKLDSKK